MSTVARFTDALGMRLVDADNCDVAMELPMARHLLNLRGSIQGGVIATLVDHAAGHAASNGHIGPGEAISTAVLSLHYLAAVEVGPARAEATVVRAGRSQIVVRINVYDAGRDRLAVISTATFSRITLREGQGVAGSPSL